MATNNTDDLVIGVSTDLSTVRRALKRFEQDISQATNSVQKKFDTLGAGINNSMNTAMQKRIEGMVGIGTKASKEWTGALAEQGKEMERLRSRYSPMFATINKYKSAVVDIRRAHGIGALSADEMTAAIQRERQAALASIAAIKQRNAAIADTPVAGRAAYADGGSFNTANIAAQFQDIGVTAAMGMNPLQIALQQGTQLSAVLEEMRGNGQSAGAAIAGAFASIISPMSLATIGVIAAGTAAVQYFSSVRSGAADVEAALEAHDALIRELKGAYGEAADGLEDYAARSRAEIEATARTNRDVLAASAQQLTREFAQLLEINQEAYYFDYRPFKEQIDAFIAGVESGDRTVLDFIADIDALAATDPGLRSMADQFIAMAQAAANAQRGVEGAKDTVSTIGEIASSQIADVDALNKALNNLANIAMPRLTESAQARKEYIDGMKAAGSDLAELTDVQQAYDAAMDRISRGQLPGGGQIPTPEEKPVLLGIAPTKSGRGGGGRSRATPADRFQQDLQMIRDRTEALRQEIDMIGLSEEAQTRRRVALDLEQRALEALREEARRKGQTDLDNIKLSDEKIAAIQREADAYARTAEELRRAQEANELTRDVTKGFVTDMLNGASAAEALSNALGKVADKLLNEVLDGILQVNAAGSKGGGFGLGSLLGGFGNMLPGSQWNIAAGGGVGLYDKGGYTGSGGKYDPAGIVHKGEYVFDQEATRRIGIGNLSRLHRGYANGGLVGGPRVPSLRMGGGQNNAPSAYNDNSVYNIDARGAQRGVGEEIKAAIAAYDKNRQRAYKGGGQPY